MGYQQRPERPFYAKIFIQAILGSVLCFGLSAGSVFLGYDVVVKDLESGEKYFIISNNIGREVSAAEIHFILFLLSTVTFAGLGVWLITEARKEWKRPRYKG